MLIQNFEQYLTKIKGAIHVGANIGEERYWYVNNGFSKVLWFEPNKELIPILEDNVKEYENHFVFNFGIHDTLTKAILHITNNKGQSSSILRLGTHADSHPDVLHIKDQVIQLKRLDSFFNETKRKVTDYNFLNVDVEGVELNVLKSFGDYITLMDYIYVEVHTGEVFKGNSSLIDVDSYLNSYNFIRFITKMTGVKWGDTLYIKKSQYETLL